MAEAMANPQLLVRRNHLPLAGVSSSAFRHLLRKGVSSARRFRSSCAMPGPQRQGLRHLPDRCRSSPSKGLRHLPGPRGRAFFIRPAAAKVRLQSPAHRPGRAVLSALTSFVRPAGRSVALFAALCACPFRSARPGGSSSTPEWPFPTAHCSPVRPR